LAQGTEWLCLEDLFEALVNITADSSINFLLKGEEVVRGIKRDRIGRSHSMEITTSSRNDHKVTGSSKGREFHGRVEHRVGVSHLS
jgi:hypothetical protein